MKENLNEYAVCASKTGFSGLLTFHETAASIARSFLRYALRKGDRNQAPAKLNKWLNYPEFVKIRKIRKTPIGPLRSLWPGIDFVNPQR